MTDAATEVHTFRDLSGYLRDALLGDTPAFFEALYAIDTIENAKMRPLVATMRDDSMQFFRMAREKLKPTKVEIASEEQRGSSWVVRFVLDDRTRLEVVVDDIYEQNVTLHTRDVIRLELR
jgi:hypothetical protein